MITLTKVEQAIAKLVDLREASNAAWLQARELADQQRDAQRAANEADANVQHAEKALQLALSDAIHHEEVCREAAATEGATS